MKAFFFTTRSLVLSCIVLASFWLLVSCSQAERPQDVSMAMVAEKSADMGLVGSFNAMPAAKAELSRMEKEKSAVPSQTRKRIVNGQLDLELNDLAAAMEGISKYNESLGGYTAANALNTAYASLTLRVPAERYSSLLGQAKAWGKLLSSETRTDDVTDSWYDLDTRLKAKRILLERYLSYLRAAKSVEDLMAIERQVSDTTTEIEQLEASFRNLDQQIAYSTLNITLHLPGSPDRTGFDLGSALQKFLKNLGEFFQNLLIWILYLVFFGIPIALLTALFFWLLFGRIGLLRRLFALLRAKRKTITS